MISKIKPGRYNLVVTSIGYDTVRENITFAADELISKNFFIEEASVNLKTVHVSAEEQSLEQKLKYL